MRTAAAPPYLLPPDDAVSADPWKGPDGTEIGERLEHWDPFTDIALVRAIRVDLDAVRSACQLEADSALAVTAAWRSSRTRLAAYGEPVELGALGGTVRAPLALTVPGVSAGGRLDLDMRLVLRTPGRNPSRISPRRAGAVLWTDTTRVTLEGGAARFPMTAADFSTTARLPDNAAWALEWDAEDLETPVLGALRLLINSTNQQLLDALRSGTTDSRSSVVRSFVTFDIARSLAYGALRNESFVEDPEAFGEGSVGRMLFELLSACWPGIPVPTLRSRVIEDPARLDAELQAHLGLLA